MVNHDREIGEERVGWLEEIELPQIRVTVLLAKVVRRGGRQRTEMGGIQQRIGLRL